MHMISEYDEPVKLQTPTLINALKLYFVETYEPQNTQMKSHPSISGDAASDPKAVYSQWMQRQFTACCDALLGTLTSNKDAQVQVSALAALMEFTRLKRLGEFDNQLFFKVTAQMLTGVGVTPEAVGALLEKYAAHADVRYHMLKSLAKLCSSSSLLHSFENTRRAANGERDDDSDAVDDEVKPSNQQLETESVVDDVHVSAHDFSRNVYDVMVRLPIVNKDAAELTSWCGIAEVGAVIPAKDGSGPRQRRKQRQEKDPTAPGQLAAKWASPKLQRRAYSDAWIALMRMDLPDDIYRKLLSRLHNLIIPNLAKPLLLSDFLYHSLDKGGLTGMLALHGIFILVTQHGLEYPKFYERLYGLLTPECFLYRYRMRFFQLADVFLASPMVPAYTAAAFIKKFGRLALVAPPAGALISIAFMHNLLRRHPACLQLIHRNPHSDAANKDLPPVWSGQDVYDPEEADPAKSRALESSLWEVTALRVHADPTVAAYSLSLDKDLGDRKRTAELDISEVLTASYSNMFAREVKRRLKQIPTAFYSVAPTELMNELTADDFPGWTI